MGGFCCKMAKHMSNSEFTSIRNYMSKPWFLKIALEGESSPLRNTISKILGGDSTSTGERVAPGPTHLLPSRGRGGEAARL